MGPDTPLVVSAHSQPVLSLWDDTTKTCEDVMNSPLDRRSPGPLDDRERDVH
ncbi:MAG: hypothetical protein JWR34_7681 [Mycobacterium sp.]|nr:hypothetical protein [Mycobacterium sp.]